MNKRKFLKNATGLIASTAFLSGYSNISFGQTDSANNSNTKTPAVFVLVHSGWGSEKQYTEVAGLLRSAGHEVYTPTLTGHGDRAHLASPELNLSTQIQDIISFIEWRDLTNVILCGHSYSGFIITGVADQLHERIHSLVYIDAMIPKNGESVVSSGPAGREEAFLAMQARGEYLLPMPEFLANSFGLDMGDVGFQPLGTFLEPITLNGSWLQVKNKIFILAVNWPPSAQRAATIEGNPDWTIVEVNAGHSVMQDVPDRLVKILESAI